MSLVLLHLTHGDNFKTEAIRSLFASVQMFMCVYMYVIFSTSGWLLSKLTCERVLFNWLEET